MHLSSTIMDYSFGIVQQQAASFCEQYSKVKGAGSPQRHPFFLQLDSLIRRVQSTVEFENNVMYVFSLEKSSFSFAFFLQSSQTSCC